MSRRPAVAARGLICQFGPVRAVVTTLLPPNAGTMEVFGLDTRRSTMRVRRLVGYENVWVFDRLFDVPRRERRGRVEGAVRSTRRTAGRLG